MKKYYTILAMLMLAGSLSCAKSDLEDAAIYDAPPGVESKTKIEVHSFQKMSLSQTQSLHYMTFYEDEVNIDDEGTISGHGALAMLSVKNTFVNKLEDCISVKHNSFDSFCELYFTPDVTNTRSNNVSLSAITVPISVKLFEEEDGLYDMVLEYRDEERVLHQFVFHGICDKAFQSANDRVHFNVSINTFEDEQLTLI